MEPEELPGVGLPGFHPARGQGQDGAVCVPCEIEHGELRGEATQVFAGGGVPDVEVIALAPCGDPAAIRLLGDPDLQWEYETAWEEWEASEDSALWDSTASDGRRGETRLVDLDPVQLGEASTRRPAVVVSNDDAVAARLGRGVVTAGPGGEVCSSAAHTGLRSVSEQPGRDLVIVPRTPCEVSAVGRQGAL